MKITCPCGEKKFNVDASLIPSEGRLLQCGFCNKEWFYKESETLKNDNIISKDNPQDEVSINESQIKPSSLVENEQEIQIPKETETIISQAEKKIKKTKNNKDNIEAKKLNVSKNNGISNFFSYSLKALGSHILNFLPIPTNRASDCKEEAFLKISGNKTLPSWSKGNIEDPKINVASYSLVSSNGSFESSHS